ncbi:hypothetical protein ACFQV4_01705 [Streptomyces thermocarboxydus]
MEVSLFPLREGPGVVGVVEDVTERQAAAERLAVLSTVHRTVGSTLDVRATADALVEALVPDFADAAAVDLLDDDPTGAAPRPVRCRRPCRCAGWRSPPRTPSSRPGAPVTAVPSRSPPRSRRPSTTRASGWSRSARTTRGWRRTRTASPPCWGGRSTP